jgi:two-component system sensor histidine kinase/response regulator
MKHWFTFISIFFIAGNVACPMAQTSDSLAKEQRSDTTEVLLLIRQSEKYLTSKPSEARQLAEKALTISRKLSYSRGEMMALNNLSDYHYRESNYARSVEYATTVLRIASQKRDSLMMVDAYRLLGNNNTFGLKQYDQALIYHLKALRILKHQNDSIKLAAEYGSTAWVYAVTGKNLTEAHRIADEGIAIALALHNNQIASYNYNSKGFLFFKEGKYDLALTSLEKSNKHGALASDKALLAFNSCLIGNIYLSLGNDETAIHFFNRSIDEGLKLNVREIIKDSYEGLAKGYAHRKQFDKAYGYHLKYTQLRDSLLNWETTQKTLMLQRGYEEERKGSIIVQLEKEKELVEREKRNNLILFASGLMVLTTILVFFIRNNRQRRTTNQLLREKNNEIRKQNEELHLSREEIAAQRDIVAEQNVQLKEANDVKNKLFSIIGHDLRGPIATLRSLLGLLERELVSADELKMLTPKINQNVGKLHEMLENLLQWSCTQMTGFSVTQVPINVSVITDNLCLLFNESAFVKEISLTNNIAKDLSLFADENQVKLILRNLISNALKFTGKGGTVTISARQPNKDNVEIIVMDSGIGISPNRIGKLFDSNANYSTVGTQGEKGTGLGLVLCKEMAEANGGSMSVTSMPGQGSSFSVFLKAHG